MWRAFANGVQQGVKPTAAGAGNNSYNHSSISDDTMIPIDGTGKPLCVAALGELTASPSEQSGALLTQLLHSLWPLHLGAILPHTGVAFCLRDDGRQVLLRKAITACTRWNLGTEQIEAQEPPQREMPAHAGGRMHYTLIARYTVQAKAWQPWQRAS